MDNHSHVVQDLPFLFILRVHRTRAIKCSENNTSNFVEGSPDKYTCMQGKQQFSISSLDIAYPLHRNILLLFHNILFAFFWGKINKLWAWDAYNPELHFLKSCYSAMHKVHLPPPFYWVKSMQVVISPPRSCRQHFLNLRCNPQLS